MDPSEVLNSMTDVVAVVMIFGIPIITTALIAAVVLSVAGKRHKERMKMIEQGMMPPPPPRKAQGYALLGWGAVSAAVGLALLVAELVSGSLKDLEGGFIFLFVGAALIIVWLIRYNAQQGEPVADQSSRSASQPPPSSLP